MIVREVITNPELLENSEFDYFNDSSDTLEWLDLMIKYPKKTEDIDLYKKVRDKLEKQTKAYWDNKKQS